MERRLTEANQSAIALYEQLESEREALAEEGIVQRPRLRVDPQTGKSIVDLRKASADCERCHGQGVTGFRPLPLGEGVVQAPVICVCVANNGGLTPDALTRIPKSTQRNRRKRRRKKHA